jgi:hypothetical protein
MNARILVLAALLATAGLAQATEFGPEDHDGMKRPAASHQNLAKRPYAAPVVKTESFEGAVVKEEVEKPKQLNLHMLGRRPYSEKAAD